MRQKILIFLMALMSVIAFPEKSYADNESTKRERNAITEGNKLYKEGRYRAALRKYEEALKENPNSAVGRYNLGLSQIRLGTNPSDTTQAAKDMAAKGCQALEQVAKMGSVKPQLASMANYNLGNVAFNSEDYKQALGYYKQALRLNPSDDNARRNLRITQLKIQDQDENQDQNQDKDQNQQNQDKDQDKQDKQDQQQDQQDQQKQDQQNNQQQQPKPQDINQQTADQILQAMENKENQTRARVATGNQGDKSKGRNRNNKNW
ncbi:MAG: tetratricopeptide repeat protein [Muribaculaceae bacterium]|nr:tetratricopeptide repeat protein [Muribaculaceae bacterium]